ncbi:MAG TPA: EamA family transporter [Ktedonobacterales bacterium]|nr:EamA family transporter [Ktedonobacterales bacterium]
MTNAPSSTRTDRWQVVAALGAIYLIWGSTYLAIRFAIDTMPPILMAGVRFAVAGVLLLVWARARGARWPSLKHWRGGLIVGGLLLFAGNGGVVLGEGLIPTGTVALLVGSVPLWMALLSWLQPGGTRPSLPVAIGLLFGFAGVALLIAPTPGAGAQAIKPLGIAIVLGAAICWAIGSLYSRGKVMHSDPIMATATEMLGGGALLLVAATVTGEWGTLHLAAISTRSWLAVAYLIVFGSLVGFTCYTWLLRNTPASVAATYAYVNPLVAVFLGWALIGEPVTARTLLAALVIITGVVIITTFQVRGRLGRRPQHASALASEPPREPALAAGPSRP